jgi:hypothetical protein
MAAAGQPAMRAAAGSGRWRQEQIRPGRLAGLAVEADRVAGCVSDARTASRTSAESGASFLCTVYFFNCGLKKFGVATVYRDVFPARCETVSVPEN